MFEIQILFNINHVNHQCWFAVAELESGEPLFESPYFIENDIQKK